MSAPRKLRVLFGEGSDSALLLDHTFFAGFVRFSVPEFYGVARGRRFALQQVLVWHTEEPRRRASFRLHGEPRELGIEYEGHLAVVGVDEIHWCARLTNRLDAVLEKSSHTVLLDLSGAPQFLDDRGEATYLFTDSGWATARRLTGGGAAAARAPCFRVGAAYPGGTVQWRIVARAHAEEEKWIAFAADRATAFALDHPHWSRGLLASCRWPSLAPGHSAETRGRFYLVEGGLDEIRDRYVRDFKEAARSADLDGEER